MATKTLLLLRHGKSDWDADVANDHDRPLARRGCKAASRVGRFLSDSGWQPELVITSTARRARATVKLAAAAGAWTCPVKKSRDLYGADGSEALQVIRQLPDDRDRVLLAGHEPAFSELLSRLIGGGQIRFPTAAVAVIGLEAVRWHQVGWGGGELLWLVIPRLLKVGECETAG